MIRVLHKAFDMLELLAAEPAHRKKLNEIAPHLHINASTCANILKTMVSRNYVDQVTPRTGYALGPMVYQLARQGAYRGDLTGAAEPLMAALARKVNETVLLVTLRAGRRFIVAQIDGRQTIQVDRNLFFQDTTYQTATGRMILAHLNERELNSFIAKEGLPGARWPEASSAASLKRELKTIRQKGFTCYRNTEDVMGVAYPIFEKDKVIAALGLFLPAFRYKSAHKAAILKEMAATSAAISACLSDDEKKANQSD